MRHFQDAHMLFYLSQESYKKRICCLVSAVLEMAAQNNGVAANGRTLFASRHWSKTTKCIHENTPSRV